MNMMRLRSQPSCHRSWLRTHLNDAKWMPATLLGGLAAVVDEDALQPQLGGHALPQAAGAHSQDVPAALLDSKLQLSPLQHRFP